MIISYKSTFRDDIKSFPQKIQIKIFELIDFVENIDSLSKIPKMRKMEGRDNVFRIHVSYRYIVFIEWNKNLQTVTFLSASSREGAY
jgi:mRNA-degrading endonuclease RelE of RelBE toxin-antitoxin system